MARKYHRIISSPDVRNPVTGQPGDYAHVWSKADLKRRTAAAKQAGVRVSVRRIRNK
ncbi:MAG TPA: hypothetical protein VNF47_23215 [Streptosporangiaceae bacterium]|nr:hypothetical protein [Streptosporangiaceae bacterium]